MKETTLTKHILLALSEAGCTVFRQNTGQGWAGRADKRPDGTVIITDARPLRAGLTRGSSDIVGIMPYPDSRFLSIEVKTAKGRVTKEQQRFIDIVRRQGGVAGVARSPDQAVQIVKDNLRE